MTDRTCERCGKKHLGEFVWLELSTLTGLYYKPGLIPQSESQGLFTFGSACAATILKAGGVNKRRRVA